MTLTRILLCEKGLLKISAVAESRQRLLRSIGRPDQRQSTKQTIYEIEVDGMIGELAVCEFLGIPYAYRQSPEPDAGYDILWQGIRIQVKATRWVNGVMLCRNHRSLKHIDVFVLAVIHSEGIDLGWIKKVGFLDEAHLGFNGDNDTLWLEQSRLLPMESLLAMPLS